MKTIVYFVRHAHSIYTPDERERPLSQEGREQASRITSLFAEVPVDVVVSSPYSRAIETIEGTAHQRNLGILEVEAFKERRLAYNAVDDFQAAMEAVWADDTFSWEGDESNVEAQLRGVEALNGLLERYKGQTIVVGTHGNLMTLMMNYFDNQYHYSFWQSLKMPDVYKLVWEDGQYVGAEQVMERMSSVGNKRKVEVYAYQEEWKQKFHEEAAQIRGALGEQVVAIHHIGSTSIPGLAGKPIIDLLPVVRKIEEVDARVASMKELGYVARGEYGLPGRRFFLKGDEERRTHHVHIYEEGSAEITRHLAFRDYIAAHPTIQHDYSTLKRQLAEKYPYDMDGYIRGKHEFVQQVEKEALVWRDLAK